MSINRKLIRPELSAARQAVSASRKKAPPVETAAEAAEELAYLQKVLAGG